MKIKGGIFMKKTIIGILTASAVLLIGTASAFAASSQTGRGFVDTNADGICDNAATICCHIAAGSVPNNSNDTDSEENIDQPRYGQNRSDTNQDGVCDYTAVCQGTKQHQRQGYRGGHNR